MLNQSIQQGIIEPGIIAIVRGDYADHIQAMAEALYAGGVRAIEVTMNSPGALTMIGDLARHFGDQMLVGGGTVLTEAEVEQIAGVGGRFVVSPDVYTPVIEKTLQLDMEPFPGAYTVTEIRTAIRAGARLIKLFPALPAGADYLKQLRGPLSDVKVVPTGGVGAEHIPAFIRVGAVAFGLGGSLIPKTLTGTQAEFDQIQQNAAQFVAIIRAARASLAA